MNHIYKVIWNKAKHCYVVASEIAKSTGKSAGAGKKALVCAALAAAALTGMGMGLAPQAAKLEAKKATQSQYIVLRASESGTNEKLLKVDGTSYTGTIQEGEIDTYNASNYVLTKCKVQETQWIGGQEQKVEVERYFWVRQGYDITGYNDGQFSVAHNSDYDDNSDKNLSFAYTQDIKDTDSTTIYGYTHDGNLTANVYGAATTSTTYTVSMYQSNHTAENPSPEYVWYAGSDGKPVQTKISIPDNTKQVKYDSETGTYYVEGSDTLKNIDASYVYAIVNGKVGDTNAKANTYVFTKEENGKTVIYKGIVYGLGGERVVTGTDNKGNMYTVWGTEVDKTQVTAEEISIDTYQKNYNRLNDGILANYKQLPKAFTAADTDTTSTNKSGTLGLLTMGDKEIKNKIEVKSEGGTEGNDTKLTFTAQAYDDGESSSFSLDTGTKVVIESQTVTGNEKTKKKVTLNGTKEYIFTDTDTTYSAGTGLTQNGTVFSNNLSVASGDKGRWTITDNKGTEDASDDLKLTNTTLADEVTKTGDSESGYTYTISDTANNTAVISDVASATKLSSVSTQVNTNQTNITELQGLVWKPKVDGRVVEPQGESKNKTVEFAGGDHIDVSAADGVITIKATDVADSNLNNITNNTTAQTNIINIAKNAVKVVKGTNTTVTEGTETVKINNVDQTITTYAVNVATDGKIEKDNTDIVNGGMVYNYVTNMGWNLKVGENSNKIKADDTVTLVNGSNISINYDKENNKITIEATGIGDIAKSSDQHIEKKTYTVGTDGKVKLTYANGEETQVEGAEAVIDGIAVVYDGQGSGKGNLISTNSKENASNDTRGGSIVLGENAQSSGYYSTVMGTNSTITTDGTMFKAVVDLGSGNSYTQDTNKNVQGTMSTVTGSYNTISNSLYGDSGIANSITGSVNTVTNSNGVVIQGTGNSVTNAYNQMKFDTKDATTIISGDEEAIVKLLATKDSGAVAVIGGANTISDTTYTTQIGFGNDITGSKNVFSAGSYNDISKLTNSLILGDNVTAGKADAETDGVISLANNREVTGNRAVIVGNATEKYKTDENGEQAKDEDGNPILDPLVTDVDDATILGYDANVTVAGGVALGANSIANRAAGATGAYRKPTTVSDDNRIWVSNKGAVSVGETDADGNLVSTRQITNVAAGSADSDAVNVAQLKEVEKKADAAASSHTVVKVNDGTSAPTDGTYSKNGNLAIKAETSTAGQTTYDIKLNDKITLGTDEDDKTVTIDGDAGTITAGNGDNKVVVDGDAGTIEAGKNVKIYGSTGNANFGGVTITNTTTETTDEEGNTTTTITGSEITGLTNKDLKADDFATVGRAATEEQLKQVISDTETKVKAATTEVVKGNNVTVEKVEPQATDGHTTYKINAYDTQLTQGKNVTITGGTLDDKGVRNYTVALSDDVEFKKITSETINTTNAYVTNVDETNDNSVINKKYFDANSKNITPGTYEVKDNKVTMTYQNGKGETISDTAVITNVASKSELDVTNQNVYNNYVAINQISGNIGRLSNRVDRVGAGAAALAALHPLDFDPDAKWDFAAGYGNYHGANAVAVGAYYRPNEDIMFSVGGSMGGGENMVNAGVSVKIGAGSSHVNNSKVAMAKEIKDLRAELEALKSAVLDGQAGRKIDTSKLQLFPDVPQNHWAYEYVAQLAGNGIIEGYPDGTFDGARPMTRYEFAAMLYRAMLGGAVLSDEILNEFAPELERFTVDTIHTDKEGNPTVERVRVAKPAKEAAE